MGTGRVRMKTPTTAQTPPIALPVSEAGVCVPYPTEENNNLCENSLVFTLDMCTTTFTIQNMRRRKKWLSHLWSASSAPTRSCPEMSTSWPASPSRRRTRGSKTSALRRPPGLWANLILCTPEQEKNLYDCINRHQQKNHKICRESFILKNQYSA